MGNLDVTFRAYLELLKIGIGTSNNKFDFSVLSEEQWNRIMKESVHQATALICFDSIKDINVTLNEKVYADWFLKATQVLKRNFAIMQQQKRLIELLNKHQISYVILKGTSSAYYYPNSEFRSFGDIDFFVDSHNIEKTKNFLLRDGYVLEEDTSPIHFEFSKNNISVELHKTISGIPDNKFGKVFTDAFKTITDDSILVDGFLKPSDFHHALVIFLHTLHHLLYNGIGMRHLCDWACFVNKTHQEDFWKNELIPLLKSTGTYKFMCGLTLASIELFNINKPVWCEEVSDDMVDTMIREIISSGNFGNKKTNKTSLLMLGQNSKKSTVFTKINNMVKALNKTNHIVCPIIKKVPIIYPFLMLYRIMRYLVLMCFGRKPSLIKMSKTANERSSVFAKYELYNIEDK